MSPTQRNCRHNKPMSEITGVPTAVPSDEPRLLLRNHLRAHCSDPSISPRFRNCNRCATRSATARTDPPQQAYLSCPAGRKTWAACCWKRWPRLPIVAVRTGVIPGIICDGLTGLPVPASDPPALARSVVRLLPRGRLSSSRFATNYDRCDLHLTVYD